MGVPLNYTSKSDPEYPALRDLLPNCPQCSQCFSFSGSRRSQNMSMFSSVQAACRICAAGM